MPTHRPQFDELVRNPRTTARGQLHHSRLARMRMRVGMGMGVGMLVGHDAKKDGMN